MTRAEKSRPLREERARLMAAIRCKEAEVKAVKQRRNGYLLIESGLRDMRRANAVLEVVGDPTKLAELSWHAVKSSPLTTSINGLVVGLADKDKETLETLLDEWGLLEGLLSEVRAQLRELYTAPSK